MENNVKVLTHSGTGYTLNKQRCESNYNSGNPNLRNGQLRHPSTFQSNNVYMNLPSTTDGTNVQQLSNNS